MKLHKMQLQTLGTFYLYRLVESSWNVMAHGDAREGKWRGNWWMECVASTLHTTSEHGVSSITTADAHTSAASSRLNWRPRGFKWTRPFRRKTKSGFCACTITFKLESTFLRKYSSALRVIKSRRMKWAGHVARMGDRRGAYRILMGRPEGKNVRLVRPMRRWEDNIKMDLQCMGWRAWTGLICLRIGTGGGR